MAKLQNINNTKQNTNFKNTGTPLGNINSFRFRFRAPSQPQFLDNFALVDDAFINVTGILYFKFLAMFLKTRSF